MATEQKQNNSGLKDRLTILLHEALLPVKDLLGEKKYTNRIRKAVKLITEGIEKKKKNSEVKPGEKETKKTETKVSGGSAEPVVKKTVKKAAPAVKKAASVAAKKAAVKKAPVKKAAPAKAAPAKKAAVKQSGTSK